MININRLIVLHISSDWWFFLLLGALLIGAGFAFYKWRIREFQKQEKLKIEFERNLADVKMDVLRAQINPHFLFNCLNSIDYYIIKNESEKASAYFTNPVEGLEFLKKIPCICFFWILKCPY